MTKASPSWRRILYVMNDGSPFSLTSLCCVHWPAARGRGMKPVGAGNESLAACRAATRPSTSALAAAPIEGPQPASVRPARQAASATCGAKGEARPTIPRRSALMGSHIARSKLANQPDRRTPADAARGTPRQAEAGSVAVGAAAIHEPVGVAQTDA